jgi:hypothetical protein
VDTQYAVPTGVTNMSSTLTAGDNLVATGARPNFVRAKMVSITGANLGRSADVRLRNSTILPFRARAMVGFEM